MRNDHVMSRPLHPQKGYKKKLEPFDPSFIFARYDSVSRQGLKPHRLVATREEIATLMAWTIWDRMNYLSDVNDMTKLGAKSKISFVEDHDKRFYEVASNDRKNPWKHKDILPNFPGGMVMVFMA